MEYEYTKKYWKDLKRYTTNKELIILVAKKTQSVIKAKALSDISELVPIRKTSAHYRIKIKLSDKNTFRIGLRVLKNTVWFSCLENNKKRFYKKFP